MDKILEVKDLSAVYGEKVIFSHLDFSLTKGQFVALTGNNGSGKSTLLKAILNIIPFAGQIIKGTSKIGYLPQSYSVDRSFPITVKEYIQLSCPEKKLSSVLSSRVFGTLKIADLQNSYLNELSQGQFQKVLFARSLVNSPELLILDEPLSNIDEETAVHLKKILLELNKQGATILLSIHDSKFVSTSCNQILSLGGKSVSIVDQCFHSHEGSEL